MNTLAAHIQHLHRQHGAGREDLGPIRAVLGGLDVEPYLAEAAADLSRTQAPERRVLVVRENPERGGLTLPADTVWIVCAEGHHLVGWWNPLLDPEQLDVYGRLREDGHNIERAADLSTHLVPSRNEAPRIQDAPEGTSRGGAQGRELNGHRPGERRGHR